MFQRTQIERRQSTQRDFALFVIDIVQRLGWQSDFQAQIRLTHRCEFRIERAVGVAVIHVLNVDTTCTGALLHHQTKQFYGRNALFANGFILLVLLIQALEFVLIGEKCVVQTRHIVW